MSSTAAAQMRLDLLNVLERGRARGIGTRDAIAALIDTAAGVTVAAALCDASEVRSGFIRAADESISRELETHDAAVQLVGLVDDEVLPVERAARRRRPRGKAVATS